MHTLSTSFILGYHGCTQEVADRLLLGDPFQPSQNDYDWLGHGIYFWESNPERAFQFAQEGIKRKTVRQSLLLLGLFSIWGYALIRPPKKVWKNEN